MHHLVFHFNDPNALIFFYGGNFLQNPSMVVDGKHLCMAVGVGGKHLCT